MSSTRTADVDPVEAAVTAATASLDARVDGRVAMLTVVGSRAYGTDRVDSDVDLRGFYVAPARRLLGTGKVAEQYELSEPDVVVYELGKFAHLAAKANPVVLETAFSPLPAHVDDVGVLLRERASVFLSRHVATTYGGYARSQLGRVQAGNVDTGEMGRRRVKHLLHCFRLLEQCRSLLATGVLDVRVGDPDRLRALAEEAAVDLDLAARVFHERLAAMDAAVASSPLPALPDADAVDRLVLDLRATAEPYLGI